MATAITERPTEPRRQSGHYRAYTPRPFTRAERDSVTILFGGLHWRVERILQAYRKDLRVHRVLLFAALEGHETGLAHARALKIPVFELLSQYIARRQAEGALRPFSPVAIITAVAGMATHYATMTQMFGYSVNTTESEIAGDFVGILMHGIRPEPQTLRQQL